MTQNLRNQPRLSLWAAVPIYLTIWAIFLIGCAAKLAAQPTGGPDGGPREGGPPAEMVAACVGKTLGAACSTTVPQLGSVKGTCFAPKGVTLACRPNGGQDRRPNGPPPGARPAGGPPAEMVAACIGKTLGAACSATVPQLGSVKGTCFAPKGATLACRPNGDQGRRPNGPPLGVRPAGGQSQGVPPPSIQQQGAPVASTKANTASILCGKATDAFNDSLGLRSASKWTCADGQRTLNANGIPGHATGKFPNTGNPNRLAAQSIRFSTTLTPVVRSGAGVVVKEPGYALNGVKFDPGTDGRCLSKVASTKDCSLDGGNGEWMIEALGQKSFNFGVDVNNAHVQPDGAYHYHGIPQGLLSGSAKAGKAMALVGWAVDGFPIYARLGPVDPSLARGALRTMRSSYKLKAKPDPFRPPTEIVPMGAFVQDYRYVKGSGDLDECNGRFSATPEFPKGIYHYYLTETYPYVQRCVKGTPSRNHERRPPR